MAAAQGQTHPVYIHSGGNSGQDTSACGRAAKEDDSVRAHFDKAAMETEEDVGMGWSL